MMAVPPPLELPRTTPRLALRVMLAVASRVAPALMASEAVTGLEGAVPRFESLLMIRVLPGWMVVLPV